MVTRLDILNNNNNNKNKTIVINILWIGSDDKGWILTFCFCFLIEIIYCDKEEIGFFKVYFPPWESRKNLSCRGIFFLNFFYNFDIHCFTNHNHGLPLGQQIDHFPWEMCIPRCFLVGGSKSSYVNRDSNLLHMSFWMLSSTGPTAGYISSVIWMLYWLRNLSATRSEKQSKPWINNKTYNIRAYLIIFYILCYTNLYRNRWVSSWAGMIR